MKGLLLALFLNLFFTMVHGQRVVHHGYVTYYNQSKKEPDSVSWVLTPAMVSLSRHVKRSNKFAPDPDIPGCPTKADYQNEEHYSKGHLFNYEDAEGDSTDRVECFYMSNMLPQNQNFNAGDWKRLENQERAWAANGTIRIIAGGIGSVGKLGSGVNIPAQMWKAIYVDGRWRGWIMDNLGSSKGHDISVWEDKDIKDFDGKTGLAL